MIFRSLYSKLALVLLGLFSAVGALLVVVTVYSTGQYEQEVNQKLNRTLAELIVSEKILLRDRSVDRAALKDVFSMLMVINPAIEVYLLDPDGRILAFSAEPGKVKRTQVSLGPVSRFLEGTQAFPILGDDPRSREGKKVFTAARIPKEGPLEGFLYVILGGETYDTVIQKVQGSHILRLSVWVTFASLFLAAVAGLLLFAWLTRRLKRLDTEMQAYSAGNSLEELKIRKSGPESRADEIARLEATFLGLAERIEAQVASIRREDLLRRELIANISHDLRTPLATLQGYIETLLMRDQVLSAADRKRYLEIAISHCMRLGKLVAGLFELAKLEARDMTIERESFSIGELAQDAVQKFELAAREKDVHISTNAGADLPFVIADIGLIGRVLENLLDNALRHTPKGGAVSIRLQPLKEAVSITVADTGSGIQEQELPRIFDRFHRADRTSSKDHAGLGLAIVKQILELHGSGISVLSSVNAGTSFTFTLPRSPA